MFKLWFVNLKKKSLLYSNQLNQIKCSSLPWDQKTFVGWISNVMITIVACGFYYTAFGTILLFFVGICQHNQAFFFQFRDMLADLDDLVSDIHVSYQNIRKALCEVIDFNKTIKK